MLIVGNAKPTATGLCLFPNAAVSQYQHFDATAVFSYFLNLYGWLSVSVFWKGGVPVSLQQWYITVMSWNQVMDSMTGSLINFNSEMGFTYDPGFSLV